MLRRIDELGRIVVPKEIRDNLKISNGESLEIFVHNNRIILKKHSVLDAISDIAQNFLDSIKELTNVAVIITDRSKVIATTEEFQKEYLGQEISNVLSDSILEQNVNKINDNYNKINIINNVELKGNFFVKPIIFNNDYTGFIIILNQKEKITDADKTIADFISDFLSKQIG
jgi:AbrB family transcriptional regulator (stage V sporulation protein T)